MTPDPSKLKKAYRKPAIPPQRPPWPPTARPAAELLFSTLRMHKGSRARTMHQGLGIALHSGGRGETVTAYSVGCQVVHGAWYGHFIGTVRRALTWEQLRNGGGSTQPVTPDSLVTSGEIVYSMIDAWDLWKAFNIAETGEEDAD